MESYFNLGKGFGYNTKSGILTEVEEEAITLVEDENKISELSKIKRVIDNLTIRDSKKSTSKFGLLLPDIKDLFPEVEFIPTSRKPLPGDEKYNYSNNSNLITITHNYSSVKDPKMHGSHSIMEHSYVCNGWYSNTETWTEEKYLQTKSITISANGITLLDVSIRTQKISESFNFLKISNRKTQKTKKIKAVVVTENLKSGLSIGEGLNQVSLSSNHKEKYESTKEYITQTQQSPITLIRDEVEDIEETFSMLNGLVLAMKFGKSAKLISTTYNYLQIFGIVEEGKISTFASSGVFYYLRFLKHSDLFILPTTPVTSINVDIKP